MSNEKCKYEVWFNMWLEVWFSQMYVLVGMICRTSGVRLAHEDGRWPGSTSGACCRAALIVSRISSGENRERERGEKGGKGACHR